MKVICSPWAPVMIVSPPGLGVVLRTPTTNRGEAVGIRDQTGSAPFKCVVLALLKEEYILFVLGVLIGGVLLACGHYWLRRALREEKSAQGMLIEVRSAKALVTTGLSLIAASAAYIFVQTLLARLLSKW